MVVPAPVLQLESVTKSYGRRRILRSVDLHVAAGETVAVLGANGAGKSTLLRVAATIARPDAGIVLVAGTDARRAPEAARRNLSVLLQDAPAYAELSPHEHLSWWSRVQALDLPAAAIDAATVAAGLARVAHQPAGSLSRGQRQRLGIAMALLPDRPLLLLDEPFAALDGDGRQWLERRLTERRAGGRATVLSVHDADEGRRLADRVLRIEGGVLS